MLFGRRINKYYLKYWYYFLAGIAALICVDTLQIFIPGLIRDLINGLDQGTLVDERMFTIILSFPLIGVLIFIGRFAWRNTIVRAGFLIDADMRSEMFIHCEKLSKSYYSEHKTGAMMALFTNDLEAVRVSISDALIFIIDALFMGTFVFIKMFQMNMILALVCAVPMFLIALSGGLIGRIEGKKFGLRQKAFEEMSDFVQENLSGIQVIKAFIRERTEIKVFAKLNKKNEETNNEYLRFSVLLNSMTNLLLYLTFAIILTVGGFFVLTGDVVIIGKVFDIGELTEFIGYFDQLIWPMFAFSMLIDLRSRGSASLKRITELLEAKVDIVDSSDSIAPIDLKGKITFKNLTFNYPDSTDAVLKNINVTIEAGETVGIIGKTGSGKSTFVNLLLRLYNLTPDELLLDDVDINKWPLKTLRSNLGYVAQESFLFSDDIEKNIAFSNPQLPLERIQQAARFACVEGNIKEFKQGYKTMVGERGVSLSGGQKQRISMARAIIKDPSILILDDSVSAVDTNTEKEILKNIKELRCGKTTLMIAHRISTMKEMDHIIVLVGGEMVAFGTHDELIESSPEYQKMVAVQKLEEEVN